MASRKAVVFVGWDSEEEGKRSVRGIEFRRRLKEDSKNKKMAAREAQRSANLDLASSAFEALLEPTNRRGVLVLVANHTDFAFLLHQFYTSVVNSRLGSIPNTFAAPRTMLRNLEDASITFQQVQQHPDYSSIFVAALAAIGINPEFSDQFLGRREGQVSSEDEAAAGPEAADEDEAVDAADEAVDAAQAPAQAPARAGRGRGREEEDQEEDRGPVRRAGRRRGREEEDQEEDHGPVRRVLRRG
jgi:hypothetical protein